MDEQTNISEAARLNPWQLGMTPPAGTYFEVAEAGAPAAGGEVAAADAGAAAAVDAGAGAGAAGADAGLGTELGTEQEQQLAQAGLSADEIRQFAREGASEGFREMLAETERQEIQARERAQREAAQQQSQQLPEWDPFNPEVVAAHTNAALQKALAPLIEAISPALDYTEHARMEQGKGEAIDILTRFEKGDDAAGIDAIGPFDHDRAILAAARYMNQDGLEPEAALERAARDQAQFEDKIRQEAYASFGDRAQALADAGTEPAGGVGAAADAVEPLSSAGARRDYREVARGTLRRAGIGGGVGAP